MPEWYKDNCLSRAQPLLCATRRQLLQGCLLARPTFQTIHVQQTQLFAPRNTKAPCMRFSMIASQRLDVVPCSRSRTLTHPVLNSRVIVHWTCRSDLGPVPRNIAAQCFIPMRSVNKIRLNSKRGVHLPNSTLKGRPLFKVTYQRPMTPIHRYAFPLRTRLLTEVHNPNASNLST